MSETSRWCGSIAVLALVACGKQQAGLPGAAGGGQLGASGVGGQPSSAAKGATAVVSGTQGGAQGGSQGLPPPPPSRGGGGSGGGGGGMLPEPSLCDLARGSFLLVAGKITAVGNSETAAQAGLATIDSMTLRYDPTVPVWPVTIQITKVEYAALDGGVPATLTFWYMGDTGPIAPNHDAITTGFFFLSQYDGQWVSLLQGIFSTDPGTGRLWSLNARYQGAAELTEADLVSQAETARVSTDPCWPPVCPDDGVWHTDGGWCSWPDAGPPVFYDGGQ